MSLAITLDFLVVTRTGMRMYRYKRYVHSFSLEWRGGGLMGNGWSIFGGGL